MTTHHEYCSYVFSITYHAQEPAYTVDFPDFRDIISSGDTLAEAFAHACEALDLHLESPAKLKRRPPKPKQHRRGNAMSNPGSLVKRSIAIVQDNLRLLLELDLADRRGERRWAKWMLKGTEN